MRKKAVAFSLTGHTDTITSLAVSPDSQSLLSKSHDSTVRTWDIRPFAPADRQIRTFDGAPTGMEKNLLKACWDTQGKRIAAGSGDGTAVLWDANTGKLLHKLPGHKGAVNDVRFAPHDVPLSKSRTVVTLGLLLMSISPYRFIRQESYTRRACRLNIVKRRICNDIQSRPGIQRRSATRSEPQ